MPCSSSLAIPGLSWNIIQRVNNEQPNFMMMVTNINIFRHCEKTVVCPLLFLWSVPYYFYFIVKRLGKHHARTTRVIYCLGHPGWSRTLPYNSSDQI
jgi:hypothetical protein